MHGIAVQVPLWKRKATAWPRGDRTPSDHVLGILCCRKYMCNNFPDNVFYTNRDNIAEKCIEGVLHIITLQISRKDRGAIFLKWSGKTNCDQVGFPSVPLYGITAY